jgi:hypothetical protein
MVFSCFVHNWPVLGGRRLIQEDTMTNHLILKTRLGAFIKDLPEQLELLQALEAAYPGKVYIYGGACRVCTSEYSSYGLNGIKDLDIVIDDSETASPKLGTHTPQPPSDQLTDIVLKSLGLKPGTLRFMFQPSRVLPRSMSHCITVNLSSCPMDIWELSKSSKSECRSFEDLFAQTDFNVNQVAVKFGTLDDDTNDVLFGDQYQTPIYGNTLELICPGQQAKLKVVKKIGKLLDQTGMNVGQSIIDWMRDV